MRVLRIGLDFAGSFQPELDAGSRLIGQEIDELSSTRHRVVFFVTFEDVAVSAFAHGNLSATAATLPASAPRISAALASRDGL